MERESLETQQHGPGGILSLQHVHTRTHNISARKLALQHMPTEGSCAGETAVLQDAQGFLKKDAHSFCFLARKNSFL